MTKQSRFLSGNYGLVSTAEDYTRFMQMLINEGRFGDTRILGPKAVQYMICDQIGAVRGPLYFPGPDYRFGLGFAVGLTDGQAPQPGSVGNYGWSGTAGTIFWVDPKENLTAVLMVQGLGVVFHNGKMIPTLVYQSIEKMNCTGGAASWVNTDDIRLPCDLVPICVLHRYRKALISADAYIAVVLQKHSTIPMINDGF